jgi:hypothetical protein
LHLEVTRRLLATRIRSYSDARFGIGIGVIVAHCLLRSL